MSEPRKVLLVGWDAADWKIANPLMDRGEMPVLAKLVSTGVMGNLATLEPMLSPLLWTSIATGKRAYDHGVTNFADVDPLTGEVHPVTSASRRCKAIWNLLAERGLKSHLVGWFATHGEQLPDGVVVSDRFGISRGGGSQPGAPLPRGTVWPEEDAAELAQLQVHPTEIQPDVISAFAPRWQEIDPSSDDRLRHLRDHLAECFSMQAAATWILENREWDFLAVYFRTIDEISHHFMPFHPPRLDGVQRHAFDVYKDVVNSAYRLHDLMLGRLIALAGPDVTVIVVSDHGFHSDHLRPTFTPDVPAGITVWHRKQGVLAASGPGLLADELVHGASLLDVTPTILALFGLPVGEDMEGKVLLHALEDPPDIETTTTWEGEPDTGTSGGSMLLTDGESRSLLEQFEALGYLEAPGGTKGDQAARISRENRWSLARACVDGARFDRALPLLEDLHEETPQRSDFAQLLAHCQTQLGMYDEARAIIDALSERFTQQAPIHLLRAEIDHEAGQPAEALAHLEAARAEGVATVRFWRQIGTIYLALDRWQDAEQAFRQALAIDPDDPVAWRGIAHSENQQGRFNEAIEAAHTALSLKFDMHLAHLDLGWAWFRQGDYEHAEQALTMALRYAPELARAHFILSEMYKIQGDEERSRAHELLRQECREDRERRAEALVQRRQEAADRQQERHRRRTEQPSREPASVAPRAAAPQVDSREIVVVSGLPRSGTSLMMQMLCAGGLEPMSDGVRMADEHNELGYFEWEEIRRLRDEPRLIDQVGDRAVKVVSALVTALPNHHRYKIIFMRRPISEILASQHRMRYGQSPTKPDDRMTAILQKHEEQTLATLRAPHVELLEVHYHQLLQDPPRHRDLLKGFLTADRLPHEDRITSVVRPELRHIRTTP